MKKTNNKKGFTLAELLIVVAIIAVLVAISIPIFTAQLRKARLATNQANARAAYAEVVANALTEGYTGAEGVYVVSTAKLSGATASKAGVSALSGSVTATPAIGDWTVDTSLSSVRSIAESKRAFSDLSSSISSVSSAIR